MAKRSKPDPAAAEADGPNVPVAVRPKYDAIWPLVEQFCRERLNDEYVAMCQRALATLARKRPSPLVNGTAKGWAAGIVRAVGYVNFLGDPDRSPCLKTADIDQAMGVSPATGAAKSKAVRDLLKMDPMGTKWTLPGFMADHPLAFMVAVDGMIMDARHAPPAVRQEAVERGLVPGMPGPSIRPATDVELPAVPRLYTLEAFLIQGPISEAFAERNPVTSRTVQVRGDQTLADLHAALFAAFDREEEHFYEFQFGKGPHDKAGPRYVLPQAAAMEDADGGDPPAGTVDVTTLDMLGLRKGRAFGYWFDFGDDWWHQINVVAVDDAVPAGVRFPRVTARVGQSPPQYAEDLD